MKTSLKVVMCYCLMNLWKMNSIEGDIKKNN